MTLDWESLLSTHQRAPAYGRWAVTEIIPSFLAAVAGDEEADRLGYGDRRRLIVVVLDGLGEGLLDRHRDVAPWLASHRRTPLDAAFPTTTVTSLASIGTGLVPGRHGLVGYSTALPDDPRPFDLLHWALGTWPASEKASDRVRPETYQPHATALLAARRAGIEVTTVMRPEFVTSGLTRAVLRGGEIVTALGLRETLRAALTAASGPTGPALVYAHEGEIDLHGHLTGPGGDAWSEVVQRVDADLSAFAEQLPADVSLLVTADHGMVTTASYVEAADDRRLTDGVRVLAGEPRCRQAHVVEGALDEVLSAWDELLSPAFDVLQRDDAIQLGWFGPVEDEVRPRIGDVLAVARDPSVALVHRDLDPYGGRLTGMHGALTPDELLVPFILVDGA